MQINLLGSKVRNPEQLVTRQSVCMDMFCWPCSACMVGPHARDSPTTGGSAQWARERPKLDKNKKIFFQNITFLLAKLKDKYIGHRVSEFP